MNELLQRISNCVEFGKIDRDTPYPPEMKGLDGARELTKKALEEGIKPNDILENALIPAMSIVGNKFSRNEIYVPQMLMAAKAMSGAMIHIKPFFLSGETKQKGTFIIGTVAGDLHDIGKNLVAMMIEGSGWQVIDIGVDAGTDKFIDAIEKHPGSVVGLSALLTTTMTNMKKSVEDIKNRHPETVIFIGGAPVTQEYCDSIGADFYSSTPQGAVEQLKKLSTRL
jgi:methanogenic corrinoid protein MtbC1